MEPAQTGEVADRLPFAPAGRGVGPLARPPPVADVAARPDRAAVDESGGPELGLATEDERVGGVDLPEPLGDAPLDDVRVTEVEDGEGLDLGRADASRQLQLSFQHLRRLVDLPEVEEEAGLGPEHEPVLRAVGVVAEERRRPRIPGHQRRVVGAVEVLERELEHHARRSPEVAGPAVHRDHALERVEHRVVVARPPGGLGEPGEIVGGQPFTAVGPAEQLERVLPAVLGEGSSTFLECVARSLSMGRVSQIGYVRRAAMPPSSGITVPLM